MDFLIFHSPSTTFALCRGVHVSFPFTTANKHSHQSHRLPCTTQIAYYDFPSRPSVTLIIISCHLFFPLLLMCEMLSICWSVSIMTFFTPFSVLITYKHLLFFFPFLTMIEVECYFCAILFCWPMYSCCSFAFRLQLHFIAAVQWISTS